MFKNVIFLKKSLLDRLFCSLCFFLISLLEAALRLYLFFFLTHAATQWLLAFRTLGFTPHGFYQPLIQRQGHGLSGTIRTQLKSQPQNPGRKKKNTHKEKAPRVRGC